MTFSSNTFAEGDIKSPAVVHMVRHIKDTVITTMWGFFSF